MFHCRHSHGLQGAEVAGDRQGVVRVGDQADVSIRAYEDQDVLAVCVCRVPGVVGEAATVAAARHAGYGTMA